jgi:hypothetical protein
MTREYSRLLMLVHVPCTVTLYSLPVSGPIVKNLQESSRIFKNLQESSRIFNHTSKVRLIIEFQKCYGVPEYSVQVLWSCHLEFISPHLAAD